MSYTENQQKRSMKKELFPTIIAMILFLGMTIELFYVDLLSGAAEIAFWMFMALALTIYYFLKKKYAFSSIAFVIFVAGSLYLYI
ncbi:hypothetical protein [Virgibacillus siamensis]|uniref:hypothetical protein n=1 Tax=Virgibacillus siamensis TaxID=480071 RepID=UPI000985E5F2|nr:hypothetical protein [Virgibacillus siamensis]